MSNHKTNTLNENSAEWTQINIETLKPETPLDMLLFGKMCQEATKGIHMQCTREYSKERAET